MSDPVVGGSIKRTSEHGRGKKQGDRLIVNRLPLSPVRKSLWDWPMEPEIRA